MLSLGKGEKYTVLGKGEKYTIPGERKEIYYP